MEVAAPCYEITEEPDPAHAELPYAVRAVEADGTSHVIARAATAVIARDIAHGLELVWKDTVTAIAGVGPLIERLRAARDAPGV